MIKSELIARIAAQNPEMYERDAEVVVNAILGRISDALAAGDRVEIRGFGAFTVKPRKGRTGRNPKTGAVVSVADKRAPTFKPGKPMQARLNGPHGQRAVEMLDPTR